MRLILVRHGLTDENLSEILQGDVNNGLNARGEQQAEQLARRLSPHHIDLIYTSDLPRARQTAVSIAQHHRPLVPIVDRRLRERSVGALSGRPYHDFIDAAKDEHQPLTHFRPASGESLQDVADRAGRWHTDMQQRHYGQLIVVVAHGHWLRSYLAWLFHGAVDERSKQFKH